MTKVIRVSMDVYEKLAWLGIALGEDTPNNVLLTISMLEPEELQVISRDYISLNARKPLT